MPDNSYQPTDRRPLASRNTRAAQAVARQLARAGVTPNTISFLGMIAGLLAGLALAATTRWPDLARAAWIAGAICVQLRLAANMLDGMVAIETKTASPLGELYNEIPDRISDSATLVGLGYAAGGHVVLGFVAALLAVFTAYVRAMGKVAGAQQEFCGPMAKPQRMFLVTVLSLYCGLAPATWQLPGQPWGPAAWLLALISLGCVITAVRRLLRIAATLRRAKAA